MVAIISLIVSVLSVGFAIYMGVVNMKRNREADERKSTTEMTTVIVKLENIGKDTSEIKNELRSVKEDVQGLRERVAIGEQSCKSLHKRVDGFEDRLKSLGQKMDKYLIEKGE